MTRLKPRAFSCKIQKFFSLPSFYTRAFLEVANLILGNRSHNLPTLYYYTCNVVIIYLCDSDHLIEKKSKVEIKSDVAFRENVCLPQVVRANKKAGLITVS